CPECGGWSTRVARAKAQAPPRAAAAAPVELAQLGGEEPPRLALGIADFDRVLGGGVVPGSLALIGGDPGIGKSTLLMQVAAKAAAVGPVLYVSGEESAHQVRLRARRLGVDGRGLYLLAETDLDAALMAAADLSPALVIVDSIQTVYTAEVASPPGSVAQLRGCTMRLMRWAKGSGVPACIVGHVTKEGELAGPRLLEHIVDVVLYLEGERFSSYRLLRSVKNRFGSVDEVGVFEMTGEGLLGVENPSAVLLAERAEGAVGSAVVPTLEGTRPLLVEVQALTNPTPFVTPRRVANGLDLGRLLLVTAVLTRRVGLALSNQDIIASVAGGFRVQEPAADLAAALAIASSFRDAPLAGDLVAVGEVGLSGELRSVGQLERRLSEAERLGFTRALVPQVALRRGQPRTKLELLSAATLREAIRLALA
ncbi:MAG: DNA repair protein RadA, partial [Dehalococcoidia bacterium]